ncbi:MAG: hypothetical protein AAF532_05400 [Planctomycetota bacterium]
MSYFLDSDWYGHDGLMQPLEAAIAYPYFRDTRYAFVETFKASGRLEIRLHDAVMENGGYPTCVGDVDALDWDCFTALVRDAISAFRKEIGVGGPPRA